MRVESLFEKGETKKAMAEAAKTLQRATNNEQKAQVYDAIGDAFFKQKDYDRAITNFSESITMAPWHSPTRIARGQAYGCKGEYDKEIEDDSEAIRLSPRNAEAYADRGWAYGAKEEYDKEIADETEAIRLDPTNAIALTVRAWAYGRKGEHDKEIADYTEAIHLAPRDATAYGSRGDCYMDMFKYNKTIADYSEMIRLMPGTAEAFAKRGNALLQKATEFDIFPWIPTDKKDRAKVINKAAADLTEAVRLDPHDIESFRNRALAYEANGDKAKAAADRAMAEKLRQEALPSGN